MKNTKKWAFSALILFMTGLVLTGIAFAWADFSLENLSGQKIIENTYEPDGEFDKIAISILNADVIFTRAEDHKTRVEIREIEKIHHYVQISDNTLQITSNDMRKWTDRLSFGMLQTSVTVYLPEDFYVSAFVMTLTVDISVPDGFSFGNLDLCTATGKLSVKGVDSESMNIDGTTGRIILTDIDIQGEFNAHMTTGNVSMKGVKAKNMTVSTTTGDVMLTDVAIEELMSVKVTTGDISFRRCDAGEAYLKATTGDIEGAFLTEKRFEAKATTGRVNVPNTQSGGLCQATTTTGHIDISIGG
ncbi:MAG: DUF4097 family beta strand repeat protein [Clostridia bacterium]|nr:DUF4097 family beta strand repeat protein [Clostridia bacterium]